MITCPDKNLFKLTAIAAAISLLTACGGSSSKDAIDDAKANLDEIKEEIKDDIDEVITGEETLEGTFIDSAVAGINYACGDLSGVTDAEGKFDYKSGDSCTFKIGDVSLGSIDNMTEEAPIVTPFDVAEDKDKAIKIASLLQTIDADGNPDNGIDITAFDATDLTGEIFSATEEDFYAAVLDLTGLTAVTLDAAAAHIELSIGESKGYHSSAIEAVISKVEAVDDVEQLDIETFLTEVHAILDTGDDSDNNDIAALKAIISIFEIINNPIVKARVDITGDTSNYTEFLPQIIDASINASEVMLKDGTGATADISNLLYDFSVRLAAASDALGASFADASYVANYGETDTGFSLDAETAYGIQAAALGYSSVLSYFSAYNYASDDYYIVQSLSQDIEVIEATYGNESNEFTETYQAKTIATDGDYTTGQIRPDLLIKDSDFGRLHTDAKHLTLAKESLISLLEVGKTLYSLESVDSAAVQQDNIEIVDAYLANLTAADGSSAPVDISFLSDDAETIAGTMNLQALYSLATAVDRDDFTITASIDCGELTYSDLYSKYMSEPMCSLGEYVDGEPVMLESDGSNLLSHSSTGYTVLYATSAEFVLEIEPTTPDALVQRLVPTCTVTENLTTSDCLD